MEDKLWNVFESSQKQQGGVLAADGDETLLQVEEYIEAEEDLNVSQRTKKSDAKSKVIKITELIGECARTNLNETPFWQLDALCAQGDPELFFPEKGGYTCDAKRICDDCKVKAQCLAFAIDNDQRFGIWGGTSERERCSMRRKLKKVTFETSTYPKVSALRR